MRKYANPSRDGMPVKFTEKLLDANGADTGGTLSGIITIEHVPRYVACVLTFLLYFSLIRCCSYTCAQCRFAQMLGGVITEAGVEGGQEMMPGVPTPTRRADKVLHLSEDTVRFLAIDCNSHIRESSLMCV